MRKTRAMRHTQTQIKLTTEPMLTMVARSEPHFQVKNCGEKKGVCKWREQNRRQSK